MEIGKRYIIVSDDDNKTFAGDVVSITDQTLVLRNHSDRTYQNGQGVHTMPLTTIISIFSVDNLIVGQPYIFTILSGEERYGEYVSISWKYGIVKIKRNTETVSFPFYWINDIRSSENDASLSYIPI
jgi:hypothetical protein